MIREAEEWEGQAAHSRYVAANAASLAQEIALRMGGFDDAAEVLAVALRIVEEVE